MIVALQARAKGRREARDHCIAWAGGGRRVIIALQARAKREAERLLAAEARARKAEEARLLGYTEVTVPSDIYYT